MKNSSKVAQEFHKESFSDSYNHTSPALYVEQLSPLDYRRPDYLELIYPFLHQLQKSRPVVNVLDLCSGYGLNSTFFRQGELDLQVLMDDRSIDSASRKSTGWTAKFVVIGHDTSKNALSYARHRGLIDHMICRDLEVDDLSDEESALIQDLDVIVSTGSLSYISEISLKRVLDKIGKGRGLSIFFWPIVGHDISGIVHLLEKNNFLVRHNSTPLWHRQFKSSAEQESLAAKLASETINPLGKRLLDGVYVTSLSAFR